MKLGSLFSGVGAFDLAWQRCGGEIAWQVENDPTCNRVLERHWPGVKRYGDIREIHASNTSTFSSNILPPVDVICGGFPCQDLSIAGKRVGLDGERSGLFFEIVRIVKEMRSATDGRYPTFVVLENVPGLLSADSGRAFARVLAGLADAGAVDIAWSVMDARWFGVPQRRRRVFALADFGGERAGQVLLEPESCERHPPARRTARARPAAGAEGGAGESGIANALTSHHGRNDPSEETLIASTLTANYGKQVDGDGGPPNLAYQCHGTNVGEMGTLRSGNGHVTGGVPFVLGLATPMMVRRLMPVEAERLLSLPDNWTAFDAAGRPISDSARYRMLGNSLVVNVAKWIFRRLLGVAERAQGGRECCAH